MLTWRFLTTLLLLTLSLLFLILKDLNFINTYCLVHPMIQDYKTVFLRQQSLTEQIYLVAAGDTVWNDCVMLGKQHRGIYWLYVFLVS